MEYTRLERWLLPRNWHNDAVLEWKQPQEAWCILEAKWFSLKRLFVLVVLFFLLGLVVLKVAVWLDKASIPILFLVLFALSIAVASLTIACVIWWFAPVIMKISNTGVTRLVWTDRKTWHFRNLQNYSYESLQSNLKVFTVLVLHNKKGKMCRVALSHSIALSELDNLLKEQGIVKAENG